MAGYFLPKEKNLFHQETFVSMAFYSPSGSAAYGRA